MKIGHLPRYGELVALLIAHRDAFRTGAEEPENGPELAEDANRLASTLESMGPTYVKLGQLLSSRVDLLPGAYIEALSRLHDHAEELDFDVVRRQIEEELGTRVSQVFESLEREPLGSASLAVVHLGVLHDGRQVAVKVQRPGIRGQILEDMDVISELAEAFDEHVGTAQRAGLSAMVEEFRHSLLSELDYRKEAATMRLFVEFLEPYDRLCTPAPLEEYSTSRVLTMELVEGRSVGSLTEPVPEARVLVDQMFKAYLDQVLVHGVFHADPHPGNVLLTAEGQLALIDLGMTARVAPDLQETLLRLLVALGDGRGAEVAGALERAGEPLDDYDEQGLVKDVSSLVITTSGARVGELEMGRQLANLARISVANGLRPAPELALLGKALLNLDDVARRLDPDYDPVSAVRSHTVELLRHRLVGAASPTNLVSAALDAKEFAERLPERMNKVLDALAEGRFQLNVEGVDESEIMRGVQKLANRAAAGLAVAAFVLAAAIFSVSRAGPRWLGESAFTIFFLGLAFLLGLGLLLASLRHDLPQHRRARRRR